ncbi:MAG: MBL fold metallo-hydrolase [Gaiellaceae bacterium]
MSEPQAVASEIEEILPGVWRWSVHDERIAFVSAAHAFASDEGTVLVDPLPLTAEPLRRLGTVAAVCLTAGSHQRSAWRYRRELGAKVYAPSLAKELEEEPDVRYGDGDVLHGGLRTVFTPGAGTTQHTLVLHREHKIAFVADLLVWPEGGEIGMVDDRYLHDPEEARRSLRRLLELKLEMLCLAHGMPVRGDPKAAIRDVLGESSS